MSGIACAGIVSDSAACQAMLPTRTTLACSLPADGWFLSSGWQS